MHRTCIGHAITCEYMCYMPMIVQVWREIGVATSAQSLAHAGLMGPWGSSGRS